MTPGGNAIEVIAHRGSNGDAPEHSLAAYRKAIEEGADALECDVRLTADGQLVLVHDRRIDRVSSGSGAVSRYSLGDLAAHAFDQEWDGSGPMDEERASLLTLEQLVALALECGVGLALETKHPVRFGHYVEEALTAVLRSFGLLQGDYPVRVMSFSRSAVRRMQRLAPLVPTVQLVDWRVLRGRIGSMPGVFAAGLSLEILRRRPEQVAALQERGHEVYVWTVDEPQDVRLCVDLGVQAIITNRPGHVRRQLLAEVGTDGADAGPR